MTTPKGFSFSVAEAAIKKPGRKDLALIVSEVDAVISGLFTTNKVKAAPVLLDLKRIRSGLARAIIVNSGNANACTGSQGIKDAELMTSLVARSLGIAKDKVYVCSTGVIGTPLPMDRIRRAIPLLVNSLSSYGVKEVAQAIMTTDTFAKVYSKTINMKGTEVAITGIAKGAGMISPNMATMLCFVLTDASITKEALDRAFKTSVQNSFNRITIDGDTSTNDTALILANKQAGNQTITVRSPYYQDFAGALSEVCLELSKMIVRDGEGATKLITLEVRNARSQRDADRAGFTVANSMLVKTAIYGNDANWGRIMAALGRSGIAINPSKTDIAINGVIVVKNGLSTGKDAEAQALMKSKAEIALTIDLHMGKACGKVLTCDLTEDYVKINAEYRT